MVSTKKQNQKDLKKHKYRAVILYDNKEHDIVSLDIKKNVFYHQEKAYNIRLDESLIITAQDLIRGKVRYVFYAVNNPDPIEFKKSVMKPHTISARDYHTQLRSHVLEQANKYATTKDLLGAMKNLKVEHVLIGLGIIGVIIYFLMGGTLT